MKTIITLGLISLSFNSSANVERKLFTMEKNYNPENIMIIHTQTDRDCRFIKSPKNSEGNYIEFYWNMNSGQQTKEVHSMIRAEIKKRVSFEGVNQARDSFKIRLNDLTELNHDLADTTMEVMSEVSSGKCEVKSVLTLGPSAGYRKIDLNRTFCEVSKNLVGIPNGCSFLQLVGKDLYSGELVKVRFKQK